MTDTTSSQPITLTGKQKRHLRALAHDLEPVLQIGKSEITPALVKEANSQIEAHELIKVRILDGDGRKEIFARLADETGSSLVQVIGKIGVFYRKRRKDPKIVLPRATKNLE